MIFHRFEVSNYDFVDHNVVITIRFYNTSVTEFKNRIFYNFNGVKNVRKKGLKRCISYPFNDYCYSVVNTK